MELFSEIHSLYYQLMMEVLQAKSPTEQQQLIDQIGFKETAFEIANYLKDGEDSWHLLKDHDSILSQAPKPFPLTQLEKSWLAAIQQDEKFDCTGEAFDLGEVDPLFDWQDYQLFDRFASDDTFNADYSSTVQLLLDSIMRKQILHLEYQAANKREPSSHFFMPLKLEYSAKNNKFRVLGKRQAGSSWKQVTFNCSDIQSIELTGETFTEDIRWSPAKLHSIVCEVKDERSALERATFHFSNYRKTLERLDDSLYRLTIFYEKKDETELLINVLSFGARMKVLEPTSFVELIMERLQRQKRLLLDTEDKQG